MSCVADGKEVTTPCLRYVCWRTDGAEEPRLWNSPPAAATESYIQDTRAKLETPLTRPPGGPEE